MTISRAAVDRPVPVLVTVITVCFNAERHIRGAMESVLAQTYPEFEYLVIDGGSRDATVDIIRSFEERFGGRLGWVSEPDAGIYDAMNKGIARARGDLVGLLNSDDAYLPTTIEAAVNAYRAGSSLGGVYGDVEVVDEHGSLLRVEQARDLTAGSLPRDMPMCHQSLFVARRVYEELGGYDTRYKILADYEFVLRALSAGKKFAHVPTVFSRFRLGGVCNGDILGSNREREQIRVRYGASKVVERMRRIRHAVNIAVYAVMRRIWGDRP